MTDTTPPTESDDLKLIRHSHEVDLPAERERTALLELENFGLKAGIDLSTRQGNAWAATYQGDWADPEAAKADYESMFPTGTPAPEPEPTKEELDTGMTQDLRDNQSGQHMPPGTTPDPDPYEAAFAAVEDAKAKHAPEDNARHQGLSAIMQAAANGDERVIWTEEKKDQWMAEAPW